MVEEKTAKAIATIKKIREHSRPVTIGLILTVAAAVMVAIFILWFMFAYDYSIAPIREASMEALL